MKLPGLFFSILCGGIALAAMPAVAVGAEEGEAPPLDVMTYNIRFGTADDGPDRWEVREARVVELLKKEKPDVIGLQEALIDQLNDLREAFPDFQFVGTGRKDGKYEGEFSAIMYDTDRLQLLRSDTFWLSESPEVPGSTHWGNRHMRVCTWAYFKDVKSGEFFYLFNTHLDHISQNSRVKSAELILKRIDAIAPDGPVILTGDFNAGEDNDVIKTVREGGFRDSFRVVKPNAKNVGTANGFREARGSTKIDYVFVDDSWKVLDAEIITDKIDNRWPSDHLPVTATLSIK